MDIQKEEFEKAYVKTDYYQINYEKTNACNSVFSWNSEANCYTWHDVNSSWLMWQQAQKVAVPEGFVLLSHEDIARLMNTIDFLGVKALGDEYISFSEIHKIVEEWQEQNKTMIEAQEQN